ALVGFLVLPRGHGGRVGAAVLSLGLGLGIGILWKGRWLTRLAGIGAGVGLAAAAWWFVPTSQGLSLWSAHAEAEVLAEHLRQTPTCDVAAFRKEQKDRDG